MNKIKAFLTSDVTLKVAKGIFTMLAFFGYTLGTVISFLAGMLIFQTTPKKFPWDDQWLIIFGHKITNDNVLIEYIQWSTSFALGYLFIILLCPQKYKVYVATICAIAISILDWMYEASIVGPDFSGKPDPGIWPFVIPLVAGYLLVLCTYKKDAVIYRFMWTKIIGENAIGLVIFSIILLFELWFWIKCC